MSVKNRAPKAEPEVMSIQDGWCKDTGDGWYAIKATMDSGCVENLGSPEMAPEFPIVPSSGSIAGQTYCVANGEDIPNRGQKDMTTYDDGGECQSRWRITDVTKPLQSVGQTCDANKAVLFMKNGGLILHLDTHTVTPFERRGGQYEVTHWLPR